MDLQQEQLEAICQILDTNYVDHSIIGRGSFNICYLLATAKGNFVVKICNKPDAENLVKEYETLKQLDREFGPEAYLIDDTLEIIPKIYFIEEFLEGVHPEVVFSEELILAMGEWYKRLHKHKKMGLPYYMNNLQEYSLIRAFEWTTSAFYRNKEILDEEFRNRLLSIYDEAFSIIKKEDKLFSDKKELSLNQGDPSRGNIFYTNGIVKLVDWEFTKYELREWDLAFFVWSRELTKEQKRLFLETANYPITKETEKQFEIIYLLHSLMLLSWMVERLNQVEKDEIDTQQKASTKEGMMDSIQESLVLLEKSLKIVKTIF
ncbi:MAG: aminoglycoside phosphotransferase family protein [Candidatus Heimdallarchaeota archaeon]